MTRFRFQILNGNILKIIALVAMTVDHIGMICFPGDLIWRYIGRLAYPIFAYMISEGCYYTKNKRKYISLIFAIGVLCQIVAYFSEHTLYMCIMITFTLSVLVIFALQKAVPGSDRRSGYTSGQKCSEERKINPMWCVITFLLICVCAFITLLLPKILSNTDFTVDYGFFGVMLPVVIYIPRLFGWKNEALRRLIQIVILGLWLVPVWLTVSRIQWFAVFACLPLLLYNGERGRANLKYLFYIYYPVHIGLIQIIYMLCTGQTLL